MPKVVDHAERRASIGRAVWRRIGVGGIDALTIRDVAREAGCTTGMITHYFASKDELIVSAMSQVADATISRLTRHQPADLESLIDALFEVLPMDEDRRVEWRVWLTFWSQTIGNSALLDRRREAEAFWHKYLRDTIGVVRREHLVSSAPDVERSVRRLRLIVDGIGVQAALDPDAWPPKRQREELAAMTALVLQGGAQ